MSLALHEKLTYHSLSLLLNIYVLDFFNTIRAALRSFRLNRTLTLVIAGKLKKTCHPYYAHKLYIIHTHVQLILILFKTIYLFSY